MKIYFCRKINILPKIADFPKAVEKNLGFLYIHYIAKNRGFPPNYKIERVEKMSVKCAFFGIFQKLVVFCCAIFFGFANAFSANLPSGYTELEYIESTGTQYIDTGFSPDANTRVDWQGQLISGSSGVLLGARVGNSNPGRFFPFAFSTGTNYRTTYGAHDVNVSADTSTVCTGSFRPSESKSIINGTTYSFVSPNFSKTESNNLLLFGVSGYGDMHYLSTGKIWYVKIWNNGTLVRNLVPATNSSGVVGMYDTVNNVFYTNKGTGTFTAGPVVGIRIATTTYNNAQFNPVVTDLNSTIATIRDVVTNTINQTKAIADLQAKKQTRPDEQCPAGKKCLLVEDNDGVPHWYEIIENIYGLPTGYTPLEYIEATGTQYIDTGYKPNNNTTIKTKTYITTNSNTPFGCRWSGSPEYDTFGAIVGGTGQLTVYYGRYSDEKYTPYLSYDKSIVHDIEINMDSIVYDGRSIPITRGSFASTENMYLGAFNNIDEIRNLITGRIYSTEIKESNIMVRNFVPAKNSSGVIGMYDLVNDVFYTNSGTGTFTAGPTM
jgi:hypothetical protein